MTAAEKKELATDFLTEFRDPDPARLATMIANDFEWKVMTRMEGMGPVKGHDGFKNFVKQIKTMMPGGLGMTIDTVICEGDRCAVQAESNTTAGRSTTTAITSISVSTATRLRRCASTATRIMRARSFSASSRRRRPGPDAFESGVLNQLYLERMVMGGR